VLQTPSSRSAVTLDYAREKPKRLGPIRAVGLFACVVWGWFILSGFRTTDFGPSIRGLAASVIVTIPFFLLPPSVLFVVGLPWRQGTRVVLLVLVAAIAASEAWAGIEEASILCRYGRRPGAYVSVQRWWPFQGHSVYYANGRWNCQD
jgi:hypothetical protein